jgi:ATP-dependent DNA helicase RecG
MDILDQALARIAGGARSAECESSALDFKEDAGSRGDLENVLVRAAVCFANAAGGVVVVGVADRATGADALRGTDLDPDWVRQRIHERTNPRLLVDVEVRYKPVRLLVVRIHPSAAVHADTAGRSWQRVGRDCKPLAPEDVARLVEERRGYDWSAEVSERSAGDVAPEAMDAARRLLRNLPGERAQYASLTDADLLSALGVLAGRARLTRAGELMFCAGRPDAILYQYRATPGGEPRVVERPAFPLLTAYLTVLELASARRNTVPVTLPNGQQIRIEDFPREAVREALSNAICHRDWRTAGTITLDHAPEVLSITSPGPLVAGVTPENILTITSHPRNPALARVARTLGLAEETGRGVDRMFREAVRAGTELPAIEGLYDRVRVSFRGGAPDTNIARFVAQLPPEEQEDTDTLLLLFHLCRTRTVTAADAAALLQKPAAEAAMVLRRLSADRPALLEPTRASAARSWPTYRLRGEALRGLGPAVLYNRRTTDDTDRKVISHVREYGTISNRTLQNFLDVSVWTARDILADLVQRGVLMRVSQQTRGPGVAWGPGPKFPKARSEPPAEPRAPDQPELPLGATRRRRRSVQAKIG